MRALRVGISTLKGSVPDGRLTRQDLDYVISGAGRGGLVLLLSVRFKVSRVLLGRIIEQLVRYVLMKVT